MVVEIGDRGFVFWPVGTGDSTTIKVDDEVYLQVDLHRMKKSEDDDDPAVDVIEELKELLPTKDGKPYLAALVITHPDEDHCKGVADLIEEFHVGEIWFSPRILDEYRKDLCDDAKALQQEVSRRVTKIINNWPNVSSGDRIRIVGYSDMLADDLQGLPEDILLVPGEETTTISEIDCSGKFRAFIHAPFAEDEFGDRNDCSVGMQVTLTNGDGEGRALLFGDLSYLILRKVFDRNDDPEDLVWDVLLAPHHCSKTTMYFKGEDDDDERFKPDIMDDFQNSQKDGALIVASCNPSFSDEDGDPPPHDKAKRRYFEIVPASDFLCTMDHPDEEEPQPIILQVGDDGLTYDGPGGGGSGGKDDLEKALASVTGSQGSIDQPIIHGE